MMRSILCCGLLLAMPAVADDTHFAGTWKGTAQRTVCGKQADSREVILILQDHTRKSKEDASGDVNGDLFVGDNKDGQVDLRFDAKAATLTSSMGSVRQPLAGFGSDMLATYWLDLKAGDSWKGVGYYQSLSGTFARPAAGCPNLINRGEILTVTLKKQ